MHTIIKASIENKTIGYFKDLEVLKDCLRISYGAYQATIHQVGLYSFIIKRHKFDDIRVQGELLELFLYPQHL